MHNVLRFRSMLLIVVLVLSIAAPLATVSAGAPTRAGEFVGSADNIDISWFRNGRCGTEATVEVYTNVRESRNGQGTRIAFRIAPDQPCAGRTIGRTNGAGDNGSAVGVYALNGDIYAYGTHFRSGAESIWTPSQVNRGIWTVSRSAFALAEGSGIGTCVEVGGFAAVQANESRGGQGDRVELREGSCTGPLVARTNGAGNNGTLLGLTVSNGVPQALITHFASGRLAIVFPDDQPGGIKDAGLVFVD